MARSIQQGSYPSYGSITVLPRNTARSKVSPAPVMPRTHSHTAQVSHQNEARLHHTEAERSL